MKMLKRWRWSRRTRRQTGDNERYVVREIAIILLPLWVRCGFWPLGQPVVGRPIIFAEFSEWNDCGHEEVRFFDMDCCLFFCWHLVIGCHHRRRNFRYPHGLQFGRVKVSLADHMHACSGIYHKLSFLRFYGGCALQNPLIGGWIECIFRFFELLDILGKIPRVSAGASLLSFSPFLRSVLILTSVGTSLIRNFDLHFSKRWSLIFSDTCLTWRRLCESYSSNWSQKLYASGFPRYFTLFGSSDGSESCETQHNWGTVFIIATAPLSSLFRFGVIALVRFLLGCSSIL